MPLAAKILEGPRLFDRSCRLILAGLRHEHPEANESELQRLLQERLDLVNRLENHDDER
jgi:hypothetical protein